MLRILRAAVLNAVNTNCAICDAILFAYCKCKALFNKNIHVLLYILILLLNANTYFFVLT